MGVMIGVMMMNMNMTFHHHRPSPLDCGIRGKRYIAQHELELQSWTKAKSTANYHQCQDQAISDLAPIRLMLMMRSATFPATLHLSHLQLPLRQLQAQLQDFRR
jgi:hypothetical protein